MEACVELKKGGSLWYCQKITDGQESVKDTVLGLWIQTI